VVRALRLLDLDALSVKNVFSRGELNARA